MPHLYAAEWLLQVVQALALAILPVVVETTDGKKIRGEFSGITADTLLITANGSVQKLPFNSLVSMKRTEIDPKVPPATSVALINGSRIFTGDLNVDNNGVLIQPRRQPPLLTPVKKVRSIRFRKSAAETDAQWLGLSNVGSGRDTLVIRRPGNRLDPQQGIILSVSDTVVVFDLDGTKIDAPINQLEGVIFGGNAEVDETPSIRITDLYGSNWALSGIKPNAGEKPLELQLDGNLQHSIPLEQVARIDWSSGIRMLAEEKATSSKFTPYLSTNVNQETLKSFFGPQQELKKDLLLNGGSMIEFRLDPKFKTVAGTVVRDDTSGLTGKLTVNIKLDGEVVWTESLTDAEPRGFELDFNKARRIILEVDAGDDGDVGDNIRFLRPRLLK
ncbi:NPCBM/NEW2 domain-containing protein [bacterium]|nr:NPCBM/NEW2 domain-containing protein [bacterium]